MTILEKKMFIRFAVRKRLSVCVCAFSLFCFEGGMWYLIVLGPDHAFLFTLE